MKRIITDFYGWRGLEYFWLIFAALFVTLLSVMMKSDALSIISAFTNVLCVILIAKGRISNYFWGAIGVLLYGYLSFKQHYYGNMLLNWGYYFPLQLIGLYLWHKHMDRKAVVEKRLLSTRQRILLLLILTVLVYLVRLYLTRSDDAMPLADAFTTILSLAGMLLTVQRYAEQWICWVLVNIVSCYMWFIPMLHHVPDAAATFAMWIIFLINALYGLCLWFKAKH